MDFNDQSEGYEEELSSLLEESKYYLVSYVIVRQKKSTTLNLVIDRKGGITHNDCLKTTKITQDFLEGKDLVEEWGIEISSPGIYRELKSLRELKAFLGHRVVISYLKDSKLLQETGQLLEASPQKIFLITEAQEEVTLPCDIIKKIRLTD